MPAISVSTPGKIILCGEHAVVYRQPAIAIPVQQVHTNTKIFAHPTSPKGEIVVRSESIGIDGKLENLPPKHPILTALDLVKSHFGIDSFPACEIRITSTIPIASGLGSSASVSVSLITAMTEFLGHPLAAEEINTLAFEVEKIHHGNPSGVDNTVVTFNRPVYFIRDELIEFIEVSVPLYFVIANTGIHGSTSEAVEKVRLNWQNNLTEYEKYFSQIGQITNSIRDHLQSGAVQEIGKLMSQNHSILQSMQVSCPELDKLVDTALKAGAFGAKLSGGGLGGNMIALVPPEISNLVAHELRNVGAISTIEMVLPVTKRG